MALYKQKIKELLAMMARLPLVLTALMLAFLARWLSWAVCKLQAADLWIVTWAAGFPKINTETFPAPIKRPRKAVTRAGLDRKYWYYN